ncbi:Variant-specific surface protein [Giardia duodenalis]|uniref:Variant-specific surface protein n=1 Tax=Giardia intestinalis TaxID=5741 RepID=V6TVY3_GIAIN|nr:Variant-specific surface protein [Giardia intestinalis]
MCSGGFFLFRGGCYKAGVAPGSEICTTASGGRCTACRTDNGLFKNPAASPTLGSECILCWDTTGANQITGVTGCSQCTKTDSNTGAATCSACQAGYVKATNANECKPCGTGCSACSASDQSQCTACLEGKYLDGTSCVDASSCTGAKYPNPKTNKCIQCATDIPECTACTYSDSLQKPVCSACGGSKPLLKTAIDGSTSCVNVDGCKSGSTHFVNDSSDKCIPCNDTTTETDANDKGKEGCMTCAKNGGAPVCSACLEGYFTNDNGVTCTKCADNCATCSEANNENRCLTCMTGLFLVTEDANKKCVPCGDTANGGIDGCAECSGTTGSLKCTKCKANYNPSGEETNLTCTRTCEDETACGGTAGACRAIVVDGDGNMKYYCSYCGESTKFPIDGICTDQQQQNTCAGGACQSCAANYFLYMGGCYSTASAPGNLMCTAAPTGICTAAVNSRYFVVPGATDKQQSVLACGNPLGVALSDTNAYVGVEGCRTCTALSEASNGAMAAAKCTACDGGKKPNLASTGCSTCDIAGCSTCKADNMCDTCVRTGSNLSTSAIAGISVTKSLSALCC